MSLEEQLEQIVAQLGRIGNLLEGHSGVANEAAQKPGAGDMAAINTKTAAKEKARAAKEETALKEPLPTPEPETGVTFDVAHKYFHEMLLKIKEHKGLPVAKTVCSKFMEKYTGGQPVTVDVMPVRSIDKFYQEVQRVRAEHGIEE